GPPAGTLVGRLSAADDRDGSVYFSLVTGTGSDDNSGFTISGSRLLTTRTFDYALKPTLSVRVRASDAGGLFSETVLTIDLIDVGEATDIDGNKYRTVRIGDQEWFADNLKVTKYSNGDPIPSYSTPESWQNSNSGARTVYNYDPAVINTYGRLYNWYASADARGVCPSGWVVPGNQEWFDLKNTLGDFEGMKLRENTGWGGDNGTNESGFSARASGRTDPSGNFCCATGEGVWWSSSTESGIANFPNPETIMVGSRFLLYATSQGLERNKAERYFGFSVRCVRDLSVNNIAPYGITLSSRKFMEGQPSGKLVGKLSALNDKDGTVYFKLVPGSGSDDNAGFSIIGDKLFTNVSFSYDAKPVLSVRVRASDAGGLFTEKTFTISLIDVNEITDIEGNRYRTVRIGSQEWMADNLKTSKYSNGDPIPSIADPGLWRSLTYGASSVYNNDPTLGQLYGKLYNGYAMSDIRGVCPSGWQVPTADDWGVLTTYLGDFGGTKLRDTRFGNGTNETGFSGLPGGYKEPSDTGYGNIGAFGHWWVSSETTNNAK
ncbi:MAG: FISUMP domain-containing protein, partial [Bacteroidota bacterium]